MQILIAGTQTVFSAHKEHKFNRQAKNSCCDSTQLPLGGFKVFSNFSSVRSKVSLLCLSCFLLTDGSECFRGRAKGRFRLSGGRDETLRLVISSHTQARRQVSRVALWFSFLSMNALSLAWILRCYCMSKSCILVRITIQKQICEISDSMTQNLLFTTIGNILNL